MVQNTIGTPGDPLVATNILNDAQSALNPTSVREVVSPSSLDDVVAAVRRAAAEGLSVSISGSRHSMGGQQFGTGNLHLDMRSLNAIRDLDAERGIVDAEAGIEWSELIDGLAALQPDAGRGWGIRQKQTGSDHLTLGGALASNVHGRGLRQRPIIDDVESFTLVDPDGRVREIDRESDPERFALAIGGYGLFGVITSIRLRLVQRQIMRRQVSLVTVDELMPAFEERIAAGALFGDCQFSVDPGSQDFLNLGILSTYAPDPSATAIPDGQRALSRADWGKLLYFTHTDPSRAAALYIEHYTATDGQLYWSDLHQRSEYVGGYHAVLDRFMGEMVPGSDIITEIYVPRHTVAAYMRSIAAEFRDGDPRIVYGTIRLVERDSEAVLTWARESWACIIFNLHARHDEHGLTEAAKGFRHLIDLALALGGSYYLTYHRYATWEQLEAAHPRIGEFLAAKTRLDPEGRFQSDWYRHLVANDPANAARMGR